MAAVVPPFLCFCKECRMRVLVILQSGGTRKKYFISRAVLGSKIF